MFKRRPKGVIEIGLATFEAAWSGRSEHLPHWVEYPDALVERIHFRAGGDLGWRLSALRTPRPRPAPWKIVVVTGAPPGRSIGRVRWRASAWIGRWLSSTGRASAPASRRIA